MPYIASLPFFSSFSLLVSKEPLCTEELVSLSQLQDAYPHLSTEGRAYPAYEIILACYQILELAQGMKAAKQLV